MTDIMTLAYDDFSRLCHRLKERDMFDMSNSLMRLYKPPVICSQPVEADLFAAARGCEEAVAKLNRWIEICMTLHRQVEPSHYYKVALATSVEKLREADCWRYARALPLLNLIEQRLVFLRRHPMDPDSPEYWYRHAQGFPFLRLPYELRNKVYDCLVPSKAVQTQRRWVDDGDLRSYWMPGVWHIPNLVLVNRQISEELREMIYHRRLYLAEIWNDGILPFRPLGLHYKPGDPTHPAIKKIQNWSFSLTALFSSGCQTLRMIRDNVETLCDIVQLGDSVMTLQVAWRVRDEYATRESSDAVFQVRTERPGCFDQITGWDWERFVHNTCQDNKCSWTPRVSWRRDRKNQSIDMTDIEYVLRPLERLRGLRRVEIILPEALHSHPRTKAYKHALETMMMSDFDDDLRITSAWPNLVEAARKSLFLRH